MQILLGLSLYLESLSAFDIMIITDEKGILKYLLFVVKVDQLLLWHSLIFLQFRNRLTYPKFVGLTKSKWYENAFDSFPLKWKSDFQL